MSFPKVCVPVERRVRSERGKWESWVREKRERGEGEKDGEKKEKGLEHNWRRCRTEETKRGRRQIRGGAKRRHGE